MSSPFASAVTESGEKTHILGDKENTSLCGQTVTAIEEGTAQYPLCVKCSQIFNTPAT